MRLGIFTRVAVAASVWWLGIATPTFVVREIESRTQGNIGLLRICMEQVERPGHDKYSECRREFEQAEAPNRADQRAWLDNFGFALMLNAIGLVAYLALYWTARWILAGREKI